MQGRISGILLYLHNEIYCSNPINLTITYQDIAEMTGMSKDTVVRVLRDLCNENVISIENASIKMTRF